MSSPRGLCDRDRCRAPLKRGKNDRSHFSPPPCTGPCRMRVVPVYASVCVRKRHGEKKKNRERKYAARTQKKTTERQREPVGGFINQGCVEQESPGGARLGRQVSVTLRGRGYSLTLQSSHTTHAHKEPKLPRDEPRFLPL